MSRHPGRAGAHRADFSAGGRASARELAENGGDSDTATEKDPMDRAVLLASVARDARLDRKYLLLVVLSVAIATLGLLQNSPAVVIGAMLVSPFLGPIMGVGFGLATLDGALVRRSLITLGAGMALAVIAAMLLVWLSPIQDVTGELRARTQPTLLDLGVAVVGGIAGVYAIMRKLSGVMVGVAIATALVPPLSTIGFGLATGRPDFAIGAALLFLTNTLAITFAATVVARLNRFGPSLSPQHTVLQVVGILGTLGLLSIPLAVSLNNIAREIAARTAVQAIMAEELGTADRIDTLNVRREGDGVVIDGVVLVERYRSGLSARVAQLAQRRLARPVTADLAQLRQQSDTASELDSRINQRLTALEQGDRQAGDVATALTVGGLIDRAAITLDPQARRAVVSRDRANEDEQVAAARDRVMAEAQRKHPDWLIANIAVEPAQTSPSTGGEPSGQ